VTGIYEVNAKGYGPVLICAYSDDISDDAVLRLIKQTLKRAKRDNLSICAITTSINDDDAIVYLHGTEGGRYR